MVLYERGPRSAPFDCETVAGVLGVCILVCGCYERDDEVFDRIE